MNHSQHPVDEAAVRSLYARLIECWNQRSAKGMAALLTKDAIVIGFDGSQMQGPEEVEKEIGKIFSNHPTSSYVTIERELRFLAKDVALLRTSAGMIPPGKNEIKPDVNAIQIMIAIKQQGEWHIASYQNTPAAFHGRPELSKQLTEELQKEAEAKKG